MSIRRLAFLFLILLIFTIPWQAVVVFPGVGTITRLIGIITIGVAIVVVLLDRKLKTPSLLFIVMSIYVIWALLSYFWSVYPVATFGRFFTNIQLLAMAWLIWELSNTSTDREILIQTYILGAYVSIITMLSTFLSPVDIGYRIGAGEFNVNRLAIILVVGIPLAWYLFLKSNNSFFKLINIAYIPLAFFCIILTASRTGFLTGVIAILIVPATIIILGQKRNYVYLFIVSIIMGGSILGFQNKIPSIERNIERIARAQDTIGEGMGIRGRIWEAGMEEFRKSPIIGVGSRGYRYAIEEGFGRAFAPHSTYYAVLVELGIIGFIIFISMFVIALTPTLYLPITDKLIYIPLFILIAIAMYPAFLEVDKMLWFLLSILSIKNAWIIKEGRIVLVNNK
jgi:O-antigen ligase